MTRTSVPPHGLPSDVTAPMHLGMRARAYRQMVRRLADALAVDDEQDPATLDDNQRQSDRETAEWLVTILYAAGYVPRKQRAWRRL